ncbi:MAG: amidohydrolase family protein [Candidatus Poribacteria bacterium]|nr:amidohydrolase family protein [Candidatus Poribacteria bacterium]
MRIDCQSHIFPKAYTEILAQNPHPPQVIHRGSEAVVTYGDVQTFRLQDAAYDPKRKLKDMDAAGVDMALLSTNIPPPCMLAPELGNSGAQVINNAIAELVEAYPQRFAGLACLPWQNPDEAITEMDRVKQLGFRGIMLYSHIGGKPVDAPEFEPVYTHAETLQMPIVMHPTVPTWGEAIKDHWMIGMMGLQVDNSFALLRLILSGILERHPDLRILMPHVGGILPYMSGRIDHQTEVLGRARENITQPPSAYLQRIYLDTVSPSVQALQYAYEYSGAARLLFGTDHPWVDMPRFVRLIEEMSIPEADKARIFSENAIKFFDL